MEGIKVRLHVHLNSVPLSTGGTIKIKVTLMPSLGCWLCCAESRLFKFPVNLLAFSFGSYPAVINSVLGASLENFRMKAETFQKEVRANRKQRILIQQQLDFSFNDVYFLEHAVIQISYRYFCMLLLNQASCQ